MITYRLHVRQTSRDRLPQVSTAGVWTNISVSRPLTSPGAQTCAATLPAPSSGDSFGRAIQVRPEATRFDQRRGAKGSVPTGRREGQPSWNSPLTCMNEDGSATLTDKYEVDFTPEEAWRLSQQAYRKRRLCRSIFSLDAGWSQPCTVAYKHWRRRKDHSHAAIGRASRRSPGKRLPSGTSARPRKVHPAIKNQRVQSTPTSWASFPCGSGVCKNSPWRSRE